MPMPALGGMKAPAGLLAVTQFAALKAGTVQTMNSAITTSLTATMKLLKRAASRVPATSSNVMSTMIAAAGRFRTAPVDDQTCCLASYANGDDTNRAGSFSPKSAARLTKYPDQPIATVTAPTAYSRIRSQPIIQATNSPSVA